MTSCGWAHNYQHLEDLVASMSIVVEKDFDTLKFVLRIEVAGCCETLGTAHKSMLRYVLDDWNIEFLQSPQLVSVSEHTSITVHLYLASRTTGDKT